MELTKLLQQTSVQELQSQSYRHKMEEVINHLLQSDFAALIHALYRIDVSEKELKEALKKAQTTDAATIITGKIIERLVQKQELQQQFKRGDIIPDDEKW